MFISPHNDDETLFGAFTIQLAQCPILIVFDSYTQVARGHANCAAVYRRRETLEAVRRLGSMPVHFLGLRDDTPYSVIEVAKSISSFIHNEQIPGEFAKAAWAPAFEHDGHDQHNLVAQAASELVLSGELVLAGRYATYTRSCGKSFGSPVPYNGELVRRKLEALACYRSQIDMVNCREHFTRDLVEYRRPA